jgi:uncharacterized protein YcbK (DUF882 family)
LNPHDYPLSNPAVMQALEQLNYLVGCDKDIVITGGDRPATSDLGVGKHSAHVLHLAADIYVPGQTNLITANEAADSGLFGGVGWYQEGYRGPHGEGPHVHVDLRKGTFRWGFPKSGPEMHGYFPKAKVSLNKSDACGCDKCGCEK